MARTKRNVVYPRVLTDGRRVWDIRYTAHGQRKVERGFASRPAAERARRKAFFRSSPPFRSSHSVPDGTCIGGLPRGSGRFCPFCGELLKLGSDNVMRGSRR